MAKEYILRLVLAIFFGLKSASTWSGRIRKKIAVNVSFFSNLCLLSKTNVTYLSWNSRVHLLAYHCVRLLKPRRYHLSNFKTAHWQERSYRNERYLLSSPPPKEHLEHSTQQLKISGTPPPPIDMVSEQILRQFGCRWWFWKKKKMVGIDRVTTDQAYSSRQLLAPYDVSSVSVSAVTRLACDIRSNTYLDMYFTYTDVTSLFLSEVFDLFQLLCELSSVICFPPLR